jgi:CDP-diacylglycerol--glycerol-3-phosphate 3-phosphatidyltransferase
MSKKIKYAVSAITISRFFGSFTLLLLSIIYDLGDMSDFTVIPVAIFYVVYVYCIASDIIDGYVARRTKTTTNIGAILDSSADLTLIAIMLIVFIPRLSFELWMLALVGAVLFVRILALGIGFAKYRTLTLLHTFMNKATGLVLASFPIFYLIFDERVALVVAFIGAFSAGVEELIITIRSKTLERNVVSMFHMNKKES